MGFHYVAQASLDPDSPALAFLVQKSQAATLSGLLPFFETGLTLLSYSWPQANFPPQS